MDPSNAPIELAKIAAEVVVRGLDRAERSAMLTAANALLRNPRALERFGAAFATGLVVELQSVQTSALNAGSPPVKG